MKKNNLGILVISIGIILSGLLVFRSQKPESGKPADTADLQEAMFYEQKEDGTVQCNLCPNRCVLQEGEHGLCKTRKNIGGKLYSLVYGKPVSLHVDPIEKKPFYHFLPGSRVYSLATAGCNLACKYCQNWDIAQRSPEDVDYKKMPPEEVVQAAIDSNSRIIAFTYNEPTVWYEYMLDIAKLAKEKKLKTVMVSSGYINQKPLKKLLPYLDAAKVDLKAFDKQTYKELIGGKREPVMENIKIIKDSGTWLEIVHLVVPEYTDDMNKVAEMCAWIKKEVGEDTPVHFSRFWPQYKLQNLPPTSEETVLKAREVCKKQGINYVYAGNIKDQSGNNTYCPKNNNPLIVRKGYFIEKNTIDKNGKTPDCKNKIPGVWK